jgi:hypothetical protein
MKTCGECKHFSPGTTTYDEIIDTIHVCNKGSICNSWNLNNDCKDFEDPDPIEQLKRDIEDFKTRQFSYAKICRRHEHPTEAEVTERKTERIVKILEEKLNDLQNN